MSSILAIRQFWIDRRRLRLIPTSMIWAGEEILELLEVRAICEGRRPVQVRQAGVITEAGTTFHPAQLVPPGADPPGRPLLSDGESVSFYFDILSFEGEGYLPKAVWVRDFGGRMYRKRLSKKRRRQLREAITKLRGRLGPDVSSQRDVFD